MKIYVADRIRYAYMGIACPGVKRLSAVQEMGKTETPRAAQNGVPTASAVN